MCFSVYLNLLQKGTSEGWKHADKLAGSEYRRGNHGVWGGAPLSSPLSSSHTRVSAFLGQLTLHVLIQRKTISSHKLG